MICTRRRLRSEVELIIKTERMGVVNQIGASSLFQAFFEERRALKSDADHG